MRRQLKFTFPCLPLAVLFASLGPCAANNLWQPAERAFNEKKYERACELLAPMINGSQKRNPEVHYLYANALAQSHRTVDAVAEFKQTLRLSPSPDIQKKSLYMIDACKKIYSSTLPAWCLNKTFPEAQGFTGLKLDAENKVTKVFSGSPAQQSGIRTGDTITAVDGDSAIPKSKLAHLIVGAVGSHVKLEIERAGALMTFDVERAIPVPQQLREKIR